MYCAKPFLAFPAAIVLVFAAAQLARAENTHSGKVVSVSEGKSGQDGKLVMTDENGKNEHSHAISSSTKITRDDKSADLHELKKGDTIKVTTAADGKVTQVAAKSGSSKSGSASRGRNSSDSEEAKLPEAFEKLNLSSQQKDKIEGIIREYDAQLESAWDDFGDRYQEAIGIEAAMLAAMEENLTDGQKKRVHEQRSKAAKGEKSDESGERSNDQGAQGAGAQSTAGQAAASGAKQNRPQANNQSNTASNNPAEEEVVIIGVSLSSDQQAAADKIHRQFFDRLQAVGQDLGRLHARLVALETEKIVNVEKVLTKDQLAQLRKRGDESGTATSEKEGSPKK